MYFAQGWFMANSGSLIAPYFVPILWISQPCPNRGYSQSITLIVKPDVWYQYHKSHHSPQFQNITTSVAWWFNRFLL